MTADSRSTNNSNNPSAHDEIRRLRHDIRGCMHGLMLLLSALETPMTHEDRAEFLGDVVTTAARMEDLMDKLQEVPEFGGPVE